MPNEKYLSILGGLLVALAATFASSRGLGQSRASVDPQLAQHVYLKLKDNSGGSRAKLLATCKLLLSGHPRTGLMKIVSFGDLFGLTPGTRIVALGTVAAGLPPYGDFAWTRRHRDTSRTNNQPTQLPSRCKLGSSDAAAAAGRRSTRSSRRSPSDFASASRTFALAELAGEAKLKRPAERRKNYGLRTALSRLNLTHARTKLKKKASQFSRLD